MTRCHRCETERHKKKEEIAFLLFFDVQTTFRTAQSLDPGAQVTFKFINTQYVYLWKGD